MKNKTLMMFAAFALVGCSTAPKCGSSANSETIFSDPKTCSVRIRQVLVATKMNLPNSVKSSDLTAWELDWQDSDLKDGRIQLGHFVLTPQTTSGSKP